jgi:hypothetical protein
LEKTRNLSIIYTLSFIITVLMVTASIAGLQYQEILYPTPELHRSFLPNELIILLIGLPMLLGSMWFTWRRRLIGLLFWPGAIFFVLYNFIIYLFALPFNTIFMLSLVLVTLSLYTLINLLASINGGLVRQRLSGASFVLADVIVVFAMGLVCFIPFVLFLRGVVKSSR